MNRKMTCRNCGFDQCACGAKDWILLPTLNEVLFAAGGLILLTVSVTGAAVLMLTL